MPKAAKDSHKANGVPQHVAIIMDGNRRWAASRGLGAVEGHRVAAEKAIEPIVDRAIELGVKYLTFWAFSTENWKRDKEEIEGLFNIFRDGLREKTKKLRQKGVRLKILGDISKFPSDIAKKAVKGVSQTAKNGTITVSFALNYGGRPEIVRAIKKIIKKKISHQQLSEELFASFLDTADMPDPDLIIRTGGEQRLSGLMPWQSIYAELYFTPTLWPDFSPAKFDTAIADFKKRHRRFGGGKFSSYQGKKS
jgi:undecaprenyl diphosphate synthase